MDTTHRRRESGRGPGDMIKTMQAPRRGAKLGHRRLSAKVPRRGTSKQTDEVSYSEK